MGFENPPKSSLRVSHRIAKLIHPAPEGTNDLCQLLDDSDPEIRCQVAELIDPVYLPRMLDDYDDNVIYWVARRINPVHLPKLIGNTSDWARYWVAQRIDPIYLPQVLSSLRTTDPHYLESSNDSTIKQIIFRRIPRELVPDKFMEEFDNFHIDKIMKT